MPPDGIENIALAIEMTEETTAAVTPDVALVCRGGAGVGLQRFEVERTRVAPLSNREREIIEPLVEHQTLIFGELHRFHIAPESIAGDEGLRG